MIVEHVLFIHVHCARVVCGFQNKRLLPVFLSQLFIKYMWILKITFYYQLSGKKVQTCTCVSV